MDLKNNAPAPGEKTECVNKVQKLEAKRTANLDVAAEDALMQRFRCLVAGNNRQIEAEAMFAALSGSGGISLERTIIADHLAVLPAGEEPYLAAINASKEKLAEEINKKYTVTGYTGRQLAGCNRILFQLGGDCGIEHIMEAQKCLSLIVGPDAEIAFGTTAIGAPDADALRVIIFGV